MTRILLLFMLMTQLPLNSFAQAEQAVVDSLLDYLQNDPEVKTDDYELINRVTAEAEDIARSIDYPEGLFRANLAQLQLNRDFAEDRVEPLIVQMDSLLELKAEDISAEHIMEYYLARGYISGKEGQFLEELQFYLKADSLCKNVPLDPSLHLYVEQHLAAYYFSQEDYENARIIFENIIEEQEKLGIPNPSGYALYTFNLGVIIKHLGDIPHAREYMLKGIELGSADYKDALYQYTMVAESYIQTDDLDSAQVYLEKATSFISNENKASIDVVNLYSLRSYYLYEQADYKASREYADRAILLSDSINYMNGAIEGHKWAVKSALAASPLKGGTLNFASLIELRDSLNRRSSMELEKKYLVEYQTLEKEAIAQQKQAENEELELENQLYKRTLILYSLLTLALFVILFLAIRRYRIKRQLAQKELEISKIEKTKIQSDLYQREKELETNIELLRDNARKLNELKSASQRAESVQQIQEIFENNYIEESQWDKIILQFESIYPDFMKELRSSDQEFTRNDMKIGILDKLGYSNQSMQEIMNISYEGVKKAKQRFNKKRKSES